ncbi:hypothetical protein QJS83_08340 [Bdellovibrio sp. 22V]|uniref:hypothetical protein n=1 Tax=Bdellovibrio sp. 22V TaxID=3044166 RepID=UPI002542C527|nr:hypothetical protein [Bdellovibrio sp. 22V]WII73885.1 hypothetical protein QJS83_08340 [Bdellovibrio sp. 22V]
MLIKTLALVVFVTSVSMSAHAKKVAVFFGGGGEPSTPGTIFDETYMAFQPFNAGSGWSTKSYFNGGHPTSERIADAMTGGKNKPMTAANMNAEIAQLKDSILNGTLKSGDQLMITVATHGLRKGGTPQRSHSVTTTDQDFNMDKLLELRNLAESKGVKLAILDFSCHSGATLNLASDKTCVISAASDNVGYNNGGEMIAKSLAKGTNLEKAFLKGRNRDGSLSPGAPQISTDAGKQAYAATKFISDSMSTGTALDHDLRNNVSCATTSSPSYKRLMRDFSAIDRETGLMHYAGVGLGIRQAKLEYEKAQLDKALKEYLQARNEIARKLIKANNSNNEKCLAVTNYQLCGRFENFEAGFLALRQLEATGRMDAKSKAEYEVYKKFINSQEYRAWSQSNEEYERAVADTSRDRGLYWKANAVAQAERDIYNKLYDHYSDKSKKPNPCRSFQL